MYVSSLGKAFNETKTELLAVGFFSHKGHKEDKEHKGFASDVYSLCSLSSLCPTI
jgi:hypothetical protein